MRKLEIDKVLTISNVHVSENTYLMLKREPYTNDMGICVYPKAEYGFWIFVPEDLTDVEDIISPYDLWNCMMLAYKNDCRWLCIDCDGMEVDELDKYYW